VGRSAELETIVQRLTQEHDRLLTLTGPASVGKTRLALAALDQLTDRFADGGLFVDLSPVREARLVLPAVAQALTITDTGTRPAAERLAAYLRERELLLILDNFEQVLPAAVPLAELLGAAPGLRLLVTSRVPLRLRAERTIRVLPLLVPEPNAVPPLPELLRIPSVALFVERAQAQRAEFTATERQIPLLVQLTRQLDGLPLALELAAAQTQSLPLAVIARRLGQRLHSLRWAAHDLPDRQRSLHAAIGWSYDLLSPPEQQLFRHLGVFVGRVSLDAIDAVVGVGDSEQTLDRLLSLAETSLVLPAVAAGSDGELAFGMLETVRQYAHEQLEAERELEAAARGHAAYYLALAEQANPELRGGSQLVWRHRLDAEHDNLRTALRWLVDAGEVEQALPLAGALGHYWWLRGYYTEGGQWLEEALSKAPAATPSIRTRALLQGGRLLAAREDLGPSMAMLQEALALAQAHEDRPGIALASLFLGASATTAGYVAEAERLLQDALDLWEGLGDDYYAAYTLASLAYLSVVQGEDQEAAERYATANIGFQQLGELAEATHLLIPAALARLRLGDRDEAVRLTQDGLRRVLAHQHPWVASLGAEMTLLLLGASGDVERRARLLGAADALAQVTGFAVGLLEAHSGQSLAALREQIEQEDIHRAYRAGGTLSLQDTVALALELLEDSAQALGGETWERELAEASPLSAREQEVLQLVAEGLTNRLIGQQLFLSPRTIDHHLSSIFTKLGVDTRAQAVAVAAQRGLL
jgi:non-specific serine/threonine protein kinase